MGALEPSVPGAVAGAASIAAGYDPDFLPGQRIELPAPASAAVEKDLAPTKAAERVRRYTHFSLAMSASRQVDDKLYSKNRLDRGHIARRADLLWGTREEAEQANVDSFFFTNITPQLDDFNQSREHGLWGELENAIFEDVDVEDLRISVFGGPIFKDTDFPYRDTLVPRSFWKVVAYVEQGTLKAQAFVLTQDDLESKLPSLGLEQFKLYQVALGDLSAMTGLDFGDLAKADTISAHPGALAPEVRRIDARSQIAAG